MTYRKYRTLGKEEFIKLQNDGKIIMVTLLMIKQHPKNHVGYSWIKEEWDYFYNAYSHSNAREFNDAYNLVKENI